MSRTASGSLTGRAAVTHLTEQRADLFEQAVKAQARRGNLALAICQDIRDMMTQEQYDAWHEAAPEIGFLEHAQAKLAELQAEPVAPVVASALDLDPQAEARETERDMQVFGPVEPWGEFTHEDWKSENDIANECRGGL